MMVYTCQYKSPMGDILLAADEIGLTGLWFVGQKYFANILPDEHIVRETPILAEAKRWLDVYFSGEEPNFTPPLHPIGSTFRQEVWQILLQIPYGQTTTYGEIAGQLAEKQTHNSYIDIIGTKGIARMTHDFKTAIVELHGVTQTHRLIQPYGGKNIDVLCKLFAESIESGKRNQIGRASCRERV